MRSYSSTNVTGVGTSFLNRAFDTVRNFFSNLWMGVSTRFTQAALAFEKKHELLSMIAAYETANSFTEPTVRRVRMAGTLLSLNSKEHLMLQEGINYFRLTEKGQLISTESVSNSALAISVSGSIASSPQRGEMRTNGIVKMGSSSYALKILPPDKRFDLETYVQSGGPL